MTGAPQEGCARRLSFNALNATEGPDFSSNIAFALYSIGTGYDGYMGKGIDSAKAGMQKLLNDIMAVSYQDWVIKAISSDFVDGGWYYDITSYLWLDGSIFITDVDSPVRAAVTVRYVGPCGYALMVSAISVQSRVQNYYDIAQNMLKATVFGGDWYESNDAGW